MEGFNSLQSQSSLPFCLLFDYKYLHAKQPCDKIHSNSEGCHVSVHMFS